MLGGLVTGATPKFHCVISTTSSAEKALLVDEDDNNDATRERQRDNADDEHAGQRCGPTCEPIDVHRDKRAGAQCALTPASVCTELSPYEGRKQQQLSSHGQPRLQQEAL